MDNLFANIPSKLPDELFETLAESPNVRIERIVSYGHTTPAGQWYDQPRHEWVVLLQGAARLRFHDLEQPIEMEPGDYLSIAAHRKHRVEWTTPDQPTIWLAIHDTAGQV